MKKNNKFGVITRPSTYIGCNKCYNFFFFDPLPYADLNDFSEVPIKLFCQKIYGYYNVTD